MEDENKEEKHNENTKEQLNNNEVLENINDNNENNIEEPENENIITKNINIWKFLIPLILVILILTYIFTDLLKTDEQNFYKYIYITSKNIDSLKSNKLEKYFQKTKYTSKGSILANCYGEELKVEFDGNTDAENRIKESNIKTKYGNSDIEIKYIQDKDTYAVKIEEFYEKYIAIENKNLKELANKLNLKSDKIPDEINMGKYIFTQEEKKYIKNRYYKIIKSKINKENYSSEEIENNKIYKLSFTNIELNNIINSILIELKDDDLILDKYISYEQISGKSINKEDIKKDIEKSIINIENNISEETEVLSISLYTKINKCEKVEIKLSDEVIVILIDKNDLKIKKENDGFNFEIQKKESLSNIKYNIKMKNNILNLDVNLNYTDLLKDKVKEDYDIDFDIVNDNIKIKYTNTTSQDDDLLVKKLDNSECEVLNNLNKNEINELIYKIYNNMINL